MQLRDGKTHKIAQEDFTYQIEYKNFMVTGQSSCLGVLCLKQTASKMGNHCHTTSFTIYVF